MPATLQWVLGIGPHPWTSTPSPRGAGTISSALGSLPGRARISETDLGTMDADESDTFEATVTLASLWFGLSGSSSVPRFAVLWRQRMDCKNLRTGIDPEQLRDMPQTCGCHILCILSVYLCIYISTQPAIVYRLNPHVQWIKATLWLNQVEIKTQIRGHSICFHLISIETWLHPSCLVVNKTNKMVHV